MDCVENPRPKVTEVIYDTDEQSPFESYIHPIAVRQLFTDI